MRILLVEDDDLIGSGVEISLSQAGYQVEWARDGHDADFALSTKEFGLLILDLGLPGRSGTDLLRALRAAGNAMPVLVLTARDTVADRIRGLDSGADDYLAKPFDLSELLARCRALLRRAQASGNEVMVWRDVTIDITAYTARRCDAEVELTAREWALLAHLVRHPGIPQSRARLEALLYGWDQGIESNAIQVHMSNLRRKLGHDLIRTVRGVGYAIDKE
ncbi:MAG TPA: response regulator transcription factor [Paraburkholderia sp.]|jgi:two-component system response regulator QseB|nr:response regulator transcription factor [Paraburkholderia sp.]